MRVRKAVIPAAGFGTRFLPATKAQPKEMLPIVDTPIIQFVVEEAVQSGVEDILIITGRGKRAIEDHFDRSIELEHLMAKGNHRDRLGALRRISDLADIHFIRQKEALGLGHAVLQARCHVGDEPFAVLLGDEVFAASPPALRQVLDLAEPIDGCVIAIRPVEPTEVERYGVIQPGTRSGELIRVIDLVEKPRPSKAPSTWAITGRYVISPAIFDILADLAPGKNGEIQLTDGLRVLGRSEPIYACEIRGRHFDVGDRLGYLKANVEFGLGRKDIGEAFAAYLSQSPTGAPWGASTVTRWRPGAKPT